MVGVGCLRAGAGRLPVHFDEMSQLRGRLVAGVRTGVEAQMRGVGIQRGAFDGEPAQHVAPVVAGEQRARAIARRSS